MNNDAEALLSDTTKLADLYEGSGKARVPLWFAIFALLALGTLLLLGKVFLDDARVRASSEDENKRNQEAFPPAERDGKRPTAISRCRRR